ncbi:MAG: NUDIX domain-containing protein [Acidimicrobiia bacterium]
MSTQSGYDPRAFPPVAVTVDIVVFTLEHGIFQVALIERGEDPHKGQLALPGGFIRPDESLIEAAARELNEETGLKVPDRLEQFSAYGDPDRDPRMRIVSVAFWAIVPDLPDPVGGTDAAAARIVPVAEVLSTPRTLAFDHHQILQDALEHARKALEDTTVATDFCSDEFSISDLRHVYETVWGVELDQGNFQKKVLDIEGFVEPTGKRRSGGQGRPPELYRSGPAERIEPPFRRPAR